MGDIIQKKQNFVVSSKEEEWEVNMVCGHKNIFWGGYICKSIFSMSLLNKEKNELTHSLRKGFQKNDILCVWRFVRYIFASLFLKSKQKHLSNFTPERFSEKGHFMHLKLVSATFLLVFLSLNKSTCETKKNVFVSLQKLFVR